MNSFPCTICKQGHAASKCPDLYDPLKEGFQGSGGGGDHEDHEKHCSFVRNGHGTFHDSVGLYNRNHYGGLHRDVFQEIEIPHVTYKIIRGW